MTGAAVIFDLDGTLIDSAPAIHAVSNAVLAELGFGALTLPQVRGFVGKGVPNLVRQLLIASGADPDGPLSGQVETALVARYETDVAGNVPYPGVPEALAALAGFGCRLAVCTNKPYRPAEAALRHVGLWDRFELVIGGDSLPSRKPDPAMLHHAHEQLGGGAMIYVGDSEVDAETAVNAEAPFLLFTEGYRKTPVHDLPHRVAFSDFTMLPGLVRHFDW
ncbi:MAG: phosphoglycolate phosphatase [Rhodobacterales bacterium 32-67-9]|nr:MAG: phosphoglycolate phosphatase [Rhodobacterales bacterium 32-67-9]